MKKINIFEFEYELTKNYKDAFDKDEFMELVTDYFKDYDYIVGDYSYGKLRLKGFCDLKSKKCNGINNIKKLDAYIKDHCAYDCSYFVLKKIKGDISA